MMCSMSPCGESMSLVNWHGLNLQEDVTYGEGPIEILDKKEQVL